MLAPIAQMTCMNTRGVTAQFGNAQRGEGDPVEMITTSTNSSHKPRFIRKAPSSAGFFRAVIRPAEVPARNTKAGAQKWVIQRVRYSAGETSGCSSGIHGHAGHQHVAGVIDGHDDDHQAAQEINAGEAVGARIPVDRLGALILLSLFR